MPKPVVGCYYVLCDDESLLGDYAGLLVFVEKGPRNEGMHNEQYRVSWGKGAYDVDWIETYMFKNSRLVD